MAAGSVHRCGTCGAPLSGIAGAVHVRCEYCESENRLVSVEAENATMRVARIQAAADGAQVLATELAARGERLFADFERASEQAAHGDRAAAAAALRHFEGYLRLQYAPTLHIYQSMEPDDPIVVKALAEIDRAIDAGVGAAATALEVPYRTVRERLGDPA
jgi:LSD1 subclass zinc finger protein